VSLLFLSPASGASPRQTFPATPTVVLEAYLQELMKCAGQDIYDGNCPGADRYLASTPEAADEEEEGEPPPDCLDVVSGFRIDSMDERGDRAEAEVSFERLGRITGVDGVLTHASRKGSIAGRLTLVRKEGQWKIDQELFRTPCLLASLSATVRDLESAVSECEDPADCEDLREVLGRLKKVR
jgi:hypothetical protein